LILLFLIVLTQSDYKNFYTVYHKDNSQILSTYSYFTPESIEIIEKNGSKIIKNIKNKNYFIFKNNLKIVPYFPDLTKEELFKRVKDKNINKEILSIFKNESLLEIYLTTIYNSVKENILKIFNKRGISKEILLSKKLKLEEKIEIINSLTKKNIDKFKNITGLFLPIFYSDYRYLFTDDYLIYIYNNALLLKRRSIVNSLFFIKSFQKIIINKIFYEEKNKDNKIFLLSAIIEQNFEYKDKKEIDSFLIKDIIEEKNLKLLELYGYFIPKIFIIDNVEKIYNKLNREQKTAFIDGFINQKEIKISQNLMKLILTDFNSYPTFLKLLTYSNRNKIYYKMIKKKIILYLNKEDNDELLINSTLYLDKKIFNLLKKREIMLLLIVDNLVKKDIEIDVVTQYAKKEVFNFKKNIHLRVSLSRYLISNNIYPNRKFLLFIKKLHNKNNLKYKTDEFYISIILPLLSQKYNQDNFKFYKNFLKTENKVMIKTLLNSIYYSKDIRFVKYLEPLLKEKEIFWDVKKVIFFLKNIKK